MKLIIERHDEKTERNMYDELLFITSKYNTILNNPRLKVHKVTNVFWGYIVMGIIIVALFTYFAIKKNSPVFIALIILAVLCIILSIKYLIDAYKFINNELSKKTKSEITINTSGVRLTKGKGFDYKMAWDDIAYVIVNKHSIVFLPKDRTMLIGINSCYNGKIVKALLDEKKDDLLIDNGLLYK